MNMLILFFIGRMIEEILGWQHFFVIYLLSGIFANAATFFLTPNVLSAGASGAIFGLFGAVAGLGYFTEMPVFKQIGKTFAVMIVIMLILEFFDFQMLGLSVGNVNIWAHIGGAIGGLMLAAIFPPKNLQRAIPRHYKWITTSIFSLMLVAFILLPFIMR
jgi:membrane associated rhomboid family serine protease